MIHSKLAQVLMVTAFSMPTVSLMAVQPASANGNNYGAIAYSSATGSHGYSYDYSTAQAAQNAALRYCENYSGTGDCKSLVVFQNACGALAQTPDNSAGSGWGSIDPLLNPLHCSPVDNLVLTVKLLVGSALVANAKSQKLGHPKSGTQRSLRQFAAQ